MKILDFIFGGGDWQIMEETNAKLVDALIKTNAENRDLRKRVEAAERDAAEATAEVADSVAKNKNAAAIVVALREKLEKAEADVRAAAERRAA